MQFGAQLVNYLCTGDDALATIVFRTHRRRRAVGI